MAVFKFLCGIWVYGSGNSTQKQRWAWAYDPARRVSLLPVIAQYFSQYLKIINRCILILVPSLQSCTFYTSLPALLWYIPPLTLGNLWIMPGRPSVILSCRWEQIINFAPLQRWVMFRGSALETGGLTLVEHFWALMNPNTLSFSPLMFL